MNEFKKQLTETLERDLDPEYVQECVSRLSVETIGNDISTTTPSGWRQTGPSHMVLGALRDHYVTHAPLSARRGLSPEQQDNLKTITERKRRSIDYLL